MFDISLSVKKQKHLKLYCYQESLDSDNFTMLTRSNKELQTLDISFSSGIPGTAFADLADNFIFLVSFERRMISIALLLTIGLYNVFIY